MSSQTRAQTRRRDGILKQSNRPPMTSGQLADLINGLSRKDRLNLAEDIEHIACALGRFAKLVRKRSAVDDIGNATGKGWRHTVGGWRGNRLSTGLRYPNLSPIRIADRATHSH